VRYNKKESNREKKYWSLSDSIIIKGVVFMARNSNKLVVPGVEQALNQLKLEIAQEFGFTNYDEIDKGELTARQNGSIGGEMTKRLIALGQQQLMNESFNTKENQSGVNEAPQFH
jgi:hypothetical protein